MKLITYMIFFVVAACGSSQPTTPEATAAAAAPSPEDLQRKAVLTKVEEMLTQDQVYSEAALKNLVVDSRSPFNKNSFDDTVAQAKKSNEKLLELTAQIKSLNPTIKDELRDQLLEYFVYEEKFNGLLSTIYIVSLSLDEITTFNKTLQSDDFKAAIGAGAISFTDVVTKLKSYQEPLQYVIDTVDTLSKAITKLSTMELALAESFKKRGLTTTPNVYTTKKDEAIKSLANMSKLVSDIKTMQSSLITDLTK